MMKKLVIFDFDGVLYDSSQLAYESIRALYPTITDEIMDEVLSGNFHEEMKKLTIPKVEETEEERRIRRARHTERKRVAPLFPGIRELLVDLHGMGRSLAINTSATEENCIPLLEYQNVSGLFDFVGTKEISPSKAEKFTIMLTHFNLTPQDTVFVTDTLGDLKEAAIVNIPTIAVTYGAHTRGHFTKEPFANLIHIVDSVKELHEKLLA